MRPLATLVPLLLLTLTSVAASAQVHVVDKNQNPFFQADQFEPLAAQGLNILNTATSDLLPHLTFPSLGVFYQFEYNSVQNCGVKCDKKTGFENSYLKYQNKLELSAEMGFFDYINIGVVLPVVVYQNQGFKGGDTTPYTYEAFGGKILPKFVLSDLRINTKVKIIDPNWAGGFGLGLIGTLYIPLQGSPFTTFKKIRVQSRLVLDWRHKGSGIHLAANGGYQWLTGNPPTRTFYNFMTASGFRWDLAARLPIPFGLQWMQLILGFFGQYPILDEQQFPNIPGGTGKVSEENLNNKNMEWVGGVQFTLPYNMVAQVGVGGPFIKQYLGTPTVRLFGSVSYTPSLEDSDGDGIADNVDKCPTQPEDHDGFEDHDGCPDPDNDDDGVPDTRDACPNDPGIRQNNGCPDDDFDKDGIPNSKDFCPNEPEDHDEFEDHDGCPDPDNDKDGIPDVEDRCPKEAEVVNGIDDDDGCPDEGESLVRVSDTKIEILDRVYFATGKSTIRERSFPVLKQVASILKNYKKIKKVSVEGHTDSVGSASSNQALSQSRAEAVMQFLIEAGVAPERLQAVGYGEAQPIDSNATQEGRERNRRVEFTILEMMGD